MDVLCFAEPLIGILTEETCKLMKYIVKNPNNCTIEDIQSEVNKIFGEIESVREYSWI